MKDVNEQTKTYYVTYRIDARYVAKVQAKTKEAALKEAEESWQSADFGEAEDITGKPVVVEDQDGNYVWEA